MIEVGNNPFQQSEGLRHLLYIEHCSVHHAV